MHHGGGAFAMGDVRFDAPYDSVRDASDRAKAIAALRDAEVLLALGGAAREGDRYLANVLTTEALNRHRRQTAWFAAVTLGAAFFIVPRVALQVFLADPRTDWSETLRVAATFLLLVGAGVVAALAYWRTRRLGMRARA